MPVVKVKNLKSEEVGEIELSDEVFGAPLNKALIYSAVKCYMANQRAGTSATKTRGDVRGSGKKLWKQKGTGRARMGSIRSPLWRHGGTVHGPVPRSYAYKLPRKMILGALRSALSAKLRDGQLTVVQTFSLPDHKSKTIRATLERLEARKKVLLVENDDNRNLSLGSRNLEGVTLVKTDMHMAGYSGEQQLLMQREQFQQALAALHSRAAELDRAVGGLPEPASPEEVPSPSAR